MLAWLWEVLELIQLPIYIPGKWWKPLELSVTFSTQIRQFSTSCPSLCLVLYKRLIQSSQLSKAGITILIFSIKTLRFREVKKFAQGDPGNKAQNSYSKLGLPPKMPYPHSYVKYFSRNPERLCMRWQYYFINWFTYISVISSPFHFTAYMSLPGFQI